MEPKTINQNREETARVDPTLLIRRTVTLNDGSEYDGSAYTNSERDLLIVNIDNLDMAAAFPIFMDPDKTKKIRSVVFNNNAHRAISDNTYEGYTRFTLIQRYGDDGISVHLRRPLPEES